MRLADDIPNDNGTRMNASNVAVIGSRNFIKPDDFLNGMIGENEIMISGGARGVDSEAAKYAESNHIKIIVIKPDYERFGKSAPLVRNTEIINLCDRVIAYWDGKSKGTLDSINKARKLGKPVEIISI